MIADHGGAQDGTLPRDVSARDPAPVERVLDGVGHGIALAGARRRAVALGRFPHVLAHAVVLLPAGQGRVEVDALPPRMAVLHEPRQAERDVLREAADQRARRARLLPRDQDGLDGDRADRRRLPLIGLRRDVDRRVGLLDALVRDRDQREPVVRGDLAAEETDRRRRHPDHRVDPARLQPGQRLGALARHELLGDDVGQLEQRRRDGTGTARARRGR
jgi:hypothetical protein